MQCLFCSINWRWNQQWGHINNWWNLNTRNKSTGKGITKSASHVLFICTTFNHVLQVSYLFPVHLSGIQTHANLLYAAKKDSWKSDFQKKAIGRRHTVPLKSLWKRCRQSEGSSVVARRSLLTADNATTEAVSSSRRILSSISGGSTARPNSTGRPMAAGEKAWAKTVTSQWLSTVHVYSFFNLTLPFNNCNKMLYLHFFW